MIETMLGGKLMARPTETEGPNACLTARLIARIDGLNREIWDLVAYKAAACEQIMAVGHGGHLCVAGTPRITCRGGVIYRKLFVERVMSLGPQGLSDE